MKSIVIKLEDFGQFQECQYILRDNSICLLAWGIIPPNIYWPAWNFPESFVLKIIDFIAVKSNSTPFFWISRKPPHLILFYVAKMMRTKHQWTRAVKIQLSIRYSKLYVILSSKNDSGTFWLRDPEVDKPFWKRNATQHRINWLIWLFMSCRNYIICFVCYISPSFTADQYSVKSSCQMNGTIEFCGWHS